MSSIDREEEYLVFVDDNFLPSEERRRIYRGAFRTERSAVEASQEIVDAALQGLQRANPSECSNPDALLEAFRMLGPDPFVIPPDGANRVSFSAAEYAAKRCAEMFSGSKKHRRNARTSVLGRGQRDILDFLRHLCGRGGFVLGDAVKRH